jgi:long-chain acyl-CoA synthetase
VETVRRLVDRHAAERGEREFLRFAPDDRSLRFGELHAALRRAGASFGRHGVGPGERVGLLLGNTPEMVVGFLGAAYAGAVAQPLNPALRADELAYLLGDSAASVLVAGPERRALAEEVRARVPTIRAVLEPAAFFSASAPQAEPPEPTLGSPAMLLHTSGTTGRPKGALLSHRNLARNAAEIAAWLRLDERDRFYGIMPLFHANGLVVTLYTALSLGATLVLDDGFHASTFWERIDRHRPTLFGSVATMLALLLARGAPASELRRDSLRYALCGSAPVPVDVIERFEASFGVPVVEGYGLTECTCRATFNPPDARRPGSIGLPIGNQVRIVGDDGRERAVGERGEIWLRGDNVMLGYLGNPQATAAAIDAEGWLKTGDLAYRDADGYLWVVGRRSDMIIRGGENLYPREIEDVLYRHPAVREACVFGVPDPLYGEEVEAAVSLRPETTATAEDLLRHCAESLASFKCPKRIRITDDLPKGPTGKIAKRTIAAAAR